VEKGEKHSKAPVIKEVRSRIGSKYHHLFVSWIVFFLVSKSIVRHVHVFSASSFKFSTKSMKDTLSKKTFGMEKREIGK
jgi:hypothetical protein